MKKNRFLLLLTCLFCYVIANAQTYTIDQGGNHATCSGTLYDSGGNGGNYGNNQNELITFCSNNSTCINVTFNSFNLDSSDFLYIYDGSNTASQPIAVLTGNTLPPNYSSFFGCLTFQFVSNDTITSSGWSATLSCGTCAFSGGGSGTLSPVYDNEACGLNYIQVSQKVTTRYATPAGTGLPSTLAVIGLPPANTCWAIEKALLYWTESSNSNGAVTVDVTNPIGAVSNYNVSPVGVGVDKCWGTTFTTNYRIDVTAAITGNGNYAVNISSGAWNVDGITLIIVYRDLLAPYTGRLMLNDGLIVNSGGSPSFVAINGINACATSTFATAFLMVGDMQDGVAPPTHTTTLNGAAIVFPNNFWNYDQTATTITAGQATAQFGASPSGGDCYSIVGAGIYYQTACLTCPSNAFAVPISQTIQTCSSGDIVANPGGGNSPYSFNWNTGDTTQTVTGLGPGVYSVTVTDNIGCISTDSIVLNIPQAIINTATTNNITCNGATNGSISISTTGGSPGYSYLWSTGDTSSTISNLPSGSYVLATTDSVNCIRIDSFYLTSPNPLIINLISNSICNNGGNNGYVYSTVTGGSLPYNYSWSNGATTDSIFNLLPGTYILTIVDSNNCTDSASISVNVFPNPAANFSIGNYALNGSIFGITKGICEFENVNFNDNSSITSGNITSWNWNFGDGSSSTLQNPSHTYSPAGNFNVQLNIVSDSGCVDSILFPITISPKPVSDFSLVDDCVYNSLVVNNLSSVPTGSIAGLNWDFGDGNTSNSFTPSHTYSVDGIYNVTLIAISDSGCTDTITKVTERYPKPTTDFYSSNVCFGDSSCFLDNSFINPSDTISSYIWNFGDGSPLLTLQNICHLYTVPGTYNVTLIATSNHNCIDDTTKQVNVYGLPIADFSFTTICENQPPTQFTDLSQGVSGGINTWNWNFGAGSSVVQNPNFTFVGDGTYPVSLAITNDVGCVDTIIKDVIVKPQPFANFDADTTNGCISLFCVNFHDTSSSNATNITSWQWDLGNNTSSSQNPSLNCYNTPGDYTVSLIVQNNLGCFDSITKVDYIHAYPLPIADFIFSPQPTDIYDPTINFTNLSFDASTWLWDFGDGVSSNSVYSPSHLYADSGSYYVQLEVWNSWGCYDSITKLIRINPVSAIFIPNTFTPDQDGKNETFFFVGFGVVERDFEFYIFDRWGENIYYTQKFEPWDGTYKNKLVEQGVYVYRFVMKDVNNEMHIFVGKVNVLK